jgi:hypothetical protein
MHKFLLFFGLSLSSCFVFASAEKIEKNCNKMYSQKLAKEKLKKVCVCVRNNLTERLNSAQLAELMQIYSRSGGRFAASKNERSKALLDFDSNIHRSCLQNPLWKMPVEDIGQPDAITD